MIVVPPLTCTHERRLLTLRAVRLIEGDMTAGEVYKVLEAVAADGKWPCADKTQPGANYYRCNAPYPCGTRQHMEQMVRLGWLALDYKAGLYKLGDKAPETPPLSAKYLRLVAAVDPNRREADHDTTETSKRCVICRRVFRSCNWTCGDPACAELLELPRELMARRSQLESEGLIAVFDVDLRSQTRFVTVTTTRGNWRTNALKFETWEQLLDRACG